MPQKELAQIVGGYNTLQHVAHGETLADEFSFHKGGYTRCAVAAYATVTYFCGAAAAAHAYEHAEPLHGARDLRAAIAAVRRVDARAQGVFHVDIGDDADDAFGHVFALHLLPDGSTQPYMSYINAYRLSQYLRRTPPLTAPQLDAFLDALATLEQEGQSAGSAAASIFSSAAHAAYASAFGVRLDAKFASWPRAPGCCASCRRATPAAWRIRAMRATRAQSPRCCRRRWRRCRCSEPDEQAHRRAWAGPPTCNAQ
jgi:hypothetical protein